MAVGYINPIAMGQNSVAAQWMYAKAAGARGGKRTQRRRRKAKAAAPSRKRRSSKRPARLVKGSRAAKAYMAKIRRKRRR